MPRNGGRITTEAFPPFVITTADLEAEEEAELKEAMTASVLTASEEKAPRKVHNYELKTALARSVSPRHNPHIVIQARAYLVRGYRARG